METKVSPPPPSSTTTITSSSPPPSSASSPSHEFSFTISFHPSPLPPKTRTTTATATATAIDLSPADEIFFHGHLLPLQLLSHPPPPNPPPPTFPPRLSTSQTPTTLVSPAATTINTNNVEANKEKTPKPTSKPFYSLFSGGRGKSRKPEEEEKKKKSSSFDVGRILKKYAVVLETLLFSRGASKEKRDLRRWPYSFSGYSNWKGREEWIEKRRKRWGQFSAPASMRTSPTNSGFLDATSGVGSSEESTMEELQNAIQAAIAHCKNSIAMKEEEKCNI